MDSILTEKGGQVEVLSVGPVDPKKHEEQRTEKIVPNTRQFYFILKFFVAQDLSAHSLLARVRNDDFVLPSPRIPSHINHPGGEAGLEFPRVFWRDGLPDDYVGKDAVRCSGWNISIR